MILTDAGPLTAIIDADEPDHDRCVAALAGLERPMLTTWPALTEAMHLLGRAGGWRGQSGLWKLVLRRDLEIADTDPRLLPRIAALMERFREVPMDLADATLVTLAEARGINRIFTLDGDFRIYRAGRREFRLVP